MKKQFNKGDVVTIKTNSSHGFAIGERVTILNVGNFTVICTNNVYAQYVDFQELKEYYLSINTNTRII